MWRGVRDAWPRGEGGRAGGRRRPSRAGQEDAAGNTSAPMRGMYLGRADITEK